MSEQQPTGGWRLLAPWTSSEGLTRWLDGTAWWGSSSMKTGPAMVVELLEAIAGRFTGQPLTLDVRGHQLTLVLDRVQVEGSEAPAPDPLTWWLDLPAGREARRWSRAVTGRPAAEERPKRPDIERVRVTSRGLAIDEKPVGDVDAIVAAVRLEFGAVTELVTGQVDLEVRTTRWAVLDWINRADHEWVLRPGTGDLIVARHDRWPGALLVRPTDVRPSAVEADVVGVRILERDVRLPARLVRHLRYELPPLSDDLSVDAVDIDAEAVTVRLRHPGIRQPVRPEHLRAAVREGVARLGGQAFA